MQHRNIYIPRFRISLVRETRGTYMEQKLSSSADADLLLRPILQDLDREHFIVIGLDAKNAVIGMNTVSIGSLTLAIVHPREVCKPLILMNAAGFICAHNHPSGDHTPSSEDRQLTTRLKQAADILGIRMLDHVIMANPAITASPTTGACHDRLQKFRERMERTIALPLTEERVFPRATRFVPSCRRHHSGA